MRKAAATGLFAGTLAASVGLAWLFRSSSHIVFESDQTRTLSHELGVEPRIAVDPFPFNNLAEKLGYTDPAVARAEAAILAERVAAGFLPNDWDERCTRNYNPSLCSMLSDYFGPRSLSSGEKRRSRLASFEARNVEVLQREDFNELYRRAPQWGFKQLAAFGERALKTESCPRNFSLALSYRVENLLPNPEALTLLEKLESHGGYCVSADDNNAEAFYLRRGLRKLARDKPTEGLPLLYMALNAKTKREEQRVLYWIARTETAAGQPGKAQVMRDVLRKRYPLSWHAILDTVENSQDPLQNLLERPLYADHQETTDLVLNKRLYWLNLLLSVEDAPYASRRFSEYVIKSLGPQPDPGLSQHLARLFDRAGLHRAQILTLTALANTQPERITRETLRLLYPKPFFEILDRHSPHLDTAILLGLARQESGFDPQATSRANAQGLLQVLPSTARGIRKSSSKQLYDYANNIEIGALFLMKMVDQFGGSVEKALAAYNAGQGSVRKWEARYTFIKDPQLFIDSIPFRETRDYVPSILRNAYWYHRLFPDLGKTLRESELIRTSALLRNQIFPPSKGTDEL